MADMMDGLCLYLGGLGSHAKRQLKRPTGNSPEDTNYAHIYMAIAIPLGIQMWH